MKAKRIVFTKPNTAELIPETLDLPKDDEVQVKLVTSTISSGTERANLTGSRSVNFRIQEEPEAIFPRYGGYSSAGIVQSIGKNVTKVKVGDPVALSWSTHSQYQNISQEFVYPISGVSFEDGALLHIATFPLAAIRKCRLELGESAIVMGMGVLGLVALQLLKAAGAAPIIAVDPMAEKREKALQCGADYALDPFEEGFAQKVKKITDGGAKVGIEVTGFGSGLDGILDCMARFGRVALLGCTRSSDFTIDYYRKVHGPGITLIGAHTMARPDRESHGGWWSLPDDIDALIKLVKLGRISLCQLVDETASPEQAGAVYHRLATDKAFPIVQFDWRDLP